MHWICCCCCFGADDHDHHGEGLSGPRPGRHLAFIHTFSSKYVLQCNAVEEAPNAPPANVHDSPPSTSSIGSLRDTHNYTRTTPPIALHLNSNQPEGRSPKFARAGEKVMVQQVVLSNNEAEDETNKRKPETPTKLSSEAAEAGECIISPSLKEDQEEKDDECPTCLEEYTLENPRIVTECSHHFHLACIYAWAERSETCPVCSKVMIFAEKC